MLMQAERLFWSQKGKASSTGMGFWTEEVVVNLLTSVMNVDSRW
jgi:hypothetical protein